MANEVPSQIDYTSRDYQALVEDLTSLVNVRTNYAWTADDPNDLGSILLESFAYMGDIMSYYIDRVANELNLDTAARRKTLVDIGRLYGYRVSGPTPARVNVVFENISDEAIDIPVGTQVLATLLYGDFTTAGQVVSLIDTDIVDNSVVVYVGQGVAFTPWSYVESLTEAGPNQLVFTTNIDEDGNVSIEFGDGINGAIPPANQVISALYRISAGSAGNLNSGTIEEVTFIPGNNVPEAIGYLSVSNPSASFGGADGDDNDQIREKVRDAITTRRRAVTLNDYSALAAQVPTVGRTKAVAAVYSAVTLYLQTQNDDSVTPGIVSGSPTLTWTDLSAAVSAYLADKIPVGTTVTVQPPTYVDFYVTLTVTANPSFSNEDVEQEIRDVFLNPGGLFAYESVDFGQLVAYSTVMAKAAGVDGVQSLVITKLNTDNSSSASTAGVQLTSGQIPVLQTTNFPSSVRSFTPKVDLVDTVFADHVNVLQDETRAVQVSLGTSLLASNYSGIFAQTATWSSLSARLANIEAGLVTGVVGSPYFKKSGDSISPASGIVGIAAKTTAGNANLIETRNAANTLRFNVDFDGLPKVGTAEVLYVGGTAYTNLTTVVNAIETIAKGNRFNPFLLAGM